MKKKGLIIIIAIIAVVILIAGSLIGTYNGLVDDREAVENANAQISIQLQRRADLIPNFVATVQGYSDYEQETFTAVTQARAKVGNSDSVAEQEQASGELNRAISIWVNAVTEAYPELKANQNYLALQDELSGSESRVATARRDYNKAAKTYNTKIKKFPTNILASVFGFDAYDYFEASEGAEKVPEVSFK